MCSELGVIHPQQGMARGHLGLRGDDMQRRLQAVGEGLGQVVSADLGFPDTKQRVADLVTGFGVAVSASRLMERQGTSVEGARVLVEGFGRVGGSAALYLTRWGAQIVGIVDLHNALISEDGLGAAEVEELLRRRTSNRLPLGGAREGATAARERFHSVPADICVCAASSGTVDGPTMDRLADQGVRAIISGANRPFASAFPGDTSIDHEADERFAVVADIIANCGTAHAFAYQIQRDEPATPGDVFDSVEVTISSALDEAVTRAGSTERGLLGAALESTLERTVTVAAT